MKFVIFPLILLTASCAAPINTADLPDMPPLALCQSYEKYSRLYTVSEGMGEAHKKAMLTSAKALYSEIEKKDINCQSVMLPPPQKKDGVKNCFPNTATGGISCL